MFPLYVNLGGKSLKIKVGQFTVANILINNNDKEAGNKYGWD